MQFVARWHHVSQWGTGPARDPGNGGNNCAEAALARIFMEMDPAGRVAAIWDLVRRVHNPSDPASIQDLIDLLIQLGKVDEGNSAYGFTSAAGIEHILQASGLGYRAVYTDTIGAAAVVSLVRQTPIALCWVDGSNLRPSSYSGDFFGGDYGWDHLIASLADDNLFNDPLTDVPDRQTDVRYDWASIQANIGGAWLIDGYTSPATAQTKVIHAGALKIQPNHTCAAAIDLQHGPVTLAVGAVVLPTGHVQTTAGETWTELRLPNSPVHGWYPSAYLKTA